MSMITNADMIELVAWRRKLHALPELSGEEAQTAREVCAFLAATAPADEVLTGLGGHGVAAIYNGKEPGPTVLFRCELDALPIDDMIDQPHHSTVPGKGHKCGHDGHMASIAALARVLARQRPRRGRAVLLFQPAEENGAGAAAVIADPQYARISPDLSFAYHNFPGIPFGHVELAEGPVCSASRGMRIILTGKQTHASIPEAGVSPAPAVARLLLDLGSLNNAIAGQADFAMATITQVAMGGPAFGIAPGRAEIGATLRTHTDDRMQALVDRAEALARHAVQASSLGLEISYDEVFEHCENAPEAVAHLRRALDAESISHSSGNFPMRGSEDFGRFGKRAPAAMFCLGAGENHPGLHTTAYDFPDDLIAIGARVMLRTLRDLLG